MSSALDLFSSFSVWHSETLAEVGRKKRFVVTVLPLISTRGVGNTVTRLMHYYRQEPKDVVFIQE